MHAPSPELEAFVREFCGVKVLPRSDEDLFKKLGVAGDDCGEFLDKFHLLFCVDMTGFLWYFHHEEEGAGIGTLFFKSPDQRVERIPITLNLLQEAIVAGHWPVQYPQHTLPERRWDMLINQLVSITLLLCLVAFVVVKLFNWRI